MKEKGPWARFEKMKAFFSGEKPLMLEKKAETMESAQLFIDVTKELIQEFKISQLLDLQISLTGDELAFFTMRTAWHLGTTILEHRVMKEAVTPAIELNPSVKDALTLHLSKYWNPVTAPAATYDRSAQAYYQAYQKTLNNAAKDFIQAVFPNLESSKDSREFFNQNWSTLSTQILAPAIPLQAKEEALRKEKIQSRKEALGTNSVLRADRRDIAAYRALVAEEREHDEAFVLPTLSLVKPVRY